MDDRTITIPVGWIAIIGALALPFVAEARVQEYQIIRLLNYKTECQLAHLEDRSTAKGLMRFFASCDNASFYPDGVDIVCDDRDDDRSCRVLTTEKTFNQLHLLDKDRQP